ncbi:serine hydrolase [Roseomonas sp. CCTCC AB2023176]|uniref:D-alanyl-D-alanine carboxypeptidase family protein n=1 Tax=Roseomonas sp. CCTCC AB2023176 TaxID=3342640 RepID=UPI0035DAEF81
MGWMLRRGLAAACGLALGALGLSHPASAQIGSDRYASIVVDGRTGNVLSAANPDDPRYPASLTKMMTLYMLFGALRDGRVTMDTRVPISVEANSRIPSKLGIPPGTSISVEVAIYALILKSANDVAVAVGELLAGDETRFAQTMTMRAREIGMTRTTFRNASGLPDWDQTTTARDMTTLGRRLYADFPDRWHFFGNAYARVGNWTFRNHNRMVGEVEGVDGIKTGYIGASGFNNVVSAQRGGQRVFAAVFGGNSGWERDQHAAMLLDEAFARLGIAPSNRPAAPAPMALVSGPAFAGAARPILMGRAQAATIAASPVPRGVRTVSTARAAAARPASVRIARGTSAAAAPRGRRVVEQGDGGNVLRLPSPPRAASSASVRPTASPARPPVRTARRG